MTFLWRWVAIVTLVTGGSLVLSPDTGRCESAAREALATVVADLLESARIHDAGGVERTVCLAGKVDRQRARRRALGLLEGDAEARFPDEFRGRYLAAVYDWYAQLTRSGGRVEEVDIDRVPLVDSGASGAPDGESDGQGTIGLRVGTEGQAADVAVVWSGGGWCLDPVTLP